jgi:hypothetical protein
MIHVLPGAEWCELSKVVRRVINLYILVTTISGKLPSSGPDRYIRTIVVLFRSLIMITVNYYDIAPANRDASTYFAYRYLVLCVHLHSHSNT